MFTNTVKKNKNMVEGFCRMIRKTYNLDLLCYDKNELYDANHDDEAEYHLVTMNCKVHKAYHCGVFGIKLNAKKCKAIESVAKKIASGVDVPCEDYK